MKYLLSVNGNVKVEVQEGECFDDVISNVDFGELFDIGTAVDNDIIHVCGSAVIYVEDDEDVDDVISNIDCGELYNIDAEIVENF